MPDSTPPRQPLSRSPSAPDAPGEEITSTYRSIYGGPRGAAASSWTSRSSGAPSASPSSTQQSTPAGPSRQHSDVRQDLSPQVSLGQEFLSATSAVRISDNSSPNAVNDAPVATLATHLEDTLLNADDVSPQPPRTSPLPQSPGDPVAKAEAAIQAARQQLMESIGKVPASPPADQHAEVFSKPTEGSNEVPVVGSDETAPASFVAASSTKEENEGHSTVTFGTEVHDYSSAEVPRSPPNEPAAPSNLLAEISPRRIPYANIAGGESAAALGAANRAAALVSKLTTGSRTEQKLAAESLLKALKEHGQPVRRATHLAGGAHMLQQLLLSSKDEELQDLCTEALVEVCRDTSALEEVADGAGVTARVVEATCRGISAGKAAHRDLFVALVGSESEEVKAACAQLKVVRQFTDQMAGHGSGGEKKEPKQAALTALDAMCAADPGPNLRKLAWSGALPTLVSYMGHPDTIPQQRAVSLRLLLRALAQDGRYADTLCTPSVIQALAEFIADPSCPVEVQAGAASVLATIAALPSKKADVTSALTDCALPRACEVLHGAGEFWESGPPVESPASTKRLAQMLIDGAGTVDALEAQLQAACAALIAHLATGSPVCCHVILFHTQVLHTLVTVLVGSHQYLLAEALLRAAGRYAASPTQMM